MARFLPDIQLHLLFSEESTAVGQTRLKVKSWEKSKNTLDHFLQNQPITVPARTLTHRCYLSALSSINKMYKRNIQVMWPQCLLHFTVQFTTRNSTWASDHQEVIHVPRVINRMETSANTEKRQTLHSQFSKRINWVLRVMLMFIISPSIFKKTLPLPKRSTSTALYLFKSNGGTAVASPPPFRPGNPALCGSRPLVTPYNCRLGDLLCLFVFALFVCYFLCVCICVICVLSLFWGCFLHQYFDTVGWVFWHVKTVSHITYTVLEGT